MLQQRAQKNEEATEKPNNMVTKKHGNFKYRKITIF